MLKLGMKPVTGVVGLEFCHVILESSVYCIYSLGKMKGTFIFDLGIFFCWLFICYNCSLVNTKGNFVLKNQP
jgi:hypothetical protein